MRVQAAPLVPHLAQSWDQIAVRIGRINESSVLKRDGAPTGVTAKLSHCGEIWDQNLVVLDAAVCRLYECFAHDAAREAGVLGRSRYERQQEQRSKSRDCGKRRFPHASDLYMYIS